MLDTLRMFFHGFAVLMTFETVIAILIGCIMGIILGAMPGIGALAGISLLLPLTYMFSPITAIALLGAIYYGNMFGGAYSAILLNIPGDGPALMTTLDGYPLTIQGKSGKALLTSNFSSAIGGTIGMIILVFFAPALARLGLKFGPAEMTGLLLLAMTSISWLVGDSPIKGLVSCLLGILVATIGIDVVSGDIRYHFGNMYLFGGIPFVPLVIGFVGFSTVIAMVSETKTHMVTGAKISMRESMPTKHEWKRLLPPAIRSGILGTFVGIVPGCGAQTAVFLGYAMQKKFFKSEVPLGTGAIEGIAAAESADNAASAGSFAPLLGFGIPGSSVGAVLLGGLMMWGLNPGPLLFSTNPDFAWGTIASLFIAGIFALGCGLLVMPWLRKILSVPMNILIPVVTTVCIVGSFSTSRSMYGVIIMLAAGVVGYVFNKFEYPTTPFMLAFILSPMLETSLRRSLLISRGSLAIFFGTPISTVFILLFIAILLTPIVRSAIKKIKQNSKTA